MHKYIKTLNIGIQSNFIYRYNFFIQIVTQFIPLITTILLWNTVFRSNSTASIGSYNQTGMICYYLLVTLIGNVVGLWFQDYEITSEIRNGQINRYLLKPISYLHYRWSLVIAKKLVYILSICIPIIIGYYFLKAYLVPPKDWFVLIQVIIAIGLGLYINFLLSFCAGLIGFWLLEVSSLFFIFYILQSMLSGQILPLDLFPKPVFTIMQWLPFQYMGYFQVKLYLGKFDTAQTLQGMFAMVLWIIALLLFTQFLWIRGTKRYSAYGG